MPASIGSVVTIYPESLLIIFSGVCVTVPPIPMFAVAPVCSCCVPSKFIVLYHNDSVHFCNLIQSSSSSCQGLEMGVLWSGVGLVDVLILFYSCTEECPVESYIVIYVFFLVGSPTISCAHLSRQLALLTDSEFISVCVSNPPPLPVLWDM